MTLHSHSRVTHVALARALAMIVAAIALFPVASLRAQMGERAVKFILPVATASGVDTITRAASPALSKALGHPVIVDNQPGAGGIVGTSALVKAVPDGYTLSIVSNNHVIYPSVYKSVPFDPIADITPIAVIGSTPIVIVVNSKVPAKNAQELIALLKANPGKYNYGSAGTGSTMYLIAELFKAQANVDLVHVAYKGGAPALSDVMGGQIPMTFLSTVASLSMVKAGRVRALGISGRSRSPVAPEIPTIAESGVPGFEFYLWQAMIVPAGIPKPIMTRLNGDVITALNHPSSKELLVNLGAEPTPSTPQEADAHIHTEVERWKRTLRAAPPQSATGR